jgi:hypothetical protein
LGVWCLGGGGLGGVGGGGARGGEMNQTLYAHMNNKRKKKEPRKQKGDSLKR